MGAMTDAQERPWPNQDNWGALRDKVSVQTDDGNRYLWTVDCGELHLPSGRLAACDPFAYLEPTGTPFINTPRGTFPVKVTLADVSDKQDRRHFREAYASIVFSANPEKYRKAIPLATDGEDRPELESDDFIGFGVDAGTACFVDETFAALFMPDPKTWNERLFDNGTSDSWFSRMNDPNHIRAGIANITLPLATNGENLILFQSGWGDGLYPIVGSFDADHHLIAAHIDLLVI